MWYSLMIFLGKPGSSLWRPRMRSSVGFRILEFRWKTRQVRRSRSWGQITGENTPLMTSRISARRQGSRGRWQSQTTLNKMGLRRERISPSLVEKYNYNLKFQRIMLGPKNNVRDGPQGMWLTFLIIDNILHKIMLPTFATSKFGKNIYNKIQTLLHLKSKKILNIISQEKYLQVCWFFMTGMTFTLVSYSKFIKVFLCWASMIIWLDSFPWIVFEFIFIN